MRLQARQCDRTHGKLLFDRHVCISPLSPDDLGHIHSGKYCFASQKDKLVQQLEPVTDSSVLEPEQSWISTGQSHKTE